MALKDTQMCHHQSFSVLLFQNLGDSLTSRNQFVVSCSWRNTVSQYLNIWWNYLSNFGFQVAFYKQIYFSPAIHFLIIYFIACLYLCNTIKCIKIQKKKIFTERQLNVTIIISLFLMQSSTERVTVLIFLVCLSDHADNDNPTLKTGVFTDFSKTFQTMWVMSDKDETYHAM